MSKSASTNAKNTRPKAQAYRGKDLESNNKTLQTMKQDNVLYKGIIDTYNALTIDKRKLTY